VAILIGVPIAIFLAERYLQQFWYKIEGYGWVFVVAALIAILISFLAVLWQTLRAARTNPATELKKE
jgi:putative ABC transport system permease protein